jgi:hypothetical protein
MTKVSGPLLAAVKVTLGASLIAAAASLPSVAEEERIAEVSVEGGVATWHIRAQGGYESAVVKLAPVGTEPVTFEPWPAGEDPAVSGLEDGLYKYELYLVPVIPERGANPIGRGEEDANGRPVGARANPRQSAERPERRAQSGSFTVGFGEMADPDAVE